MPSLLTEHASSSLGRDVLFEKIHRMTKALDTLGSVVEAGQVRVSSKALLTIAKNVSCPEIGKHLRDPYMDCCRMVRDLRLLVNTFGYILKPESLT